MALACFAVVGAMASALAYRDAAVCRGAAASSTAAMSGAVSPDALGAPASEEDPAALSTSMVNR